MHRAVLSTLAATCFMISAPAWAQISLVRVTSCASGAYPATTCTIPATAAGNLIVVGWSSSYGSMPTIISVTDNAGNVYAEAGNARAVDAAALQMVDIWYARNSKAGATALTITPNPSGNSGAGVVWEFSGVDTVSPLDQSSTLNSQPASSSPFGASVTTTAPGEAIVSVLVPGGSMTGIHAGNAFTNDLTFFGVGWGHLIAPASGTYAGQWDTSNGGFASSTVSFKAAAGGGGTPANACDLAAPWGVVDNSDIQAAKDMSLGVIPCNANVIAPGVCNVVLVQRVINVTLGGGCLTGNGTPVQHSVALNWVASTSTNVTGYKVYRSSTAGGPYTLLSSLGLVTTYTDSAVQSGQTYYYVVTAMDATNNLESSNSNQATAVIP